MTGKTIGFNNSWLGKTDPNGYKISEWLRKDQVGGFCTVCVKSITLLKGLDGILQHSKGQKHKDCCKVKLNSSQLRFSSVRPAEPNANENQTAEVTLLNLRDKAAKQELLWVMKCVASNYSSNSCEGLKDVFAAMFGEDTVAEFSLGKTKFRYLVTEALWPYLQKQLIEDIAGSWYSVSFDETTNDASHKELQIGVTYWSESAGIVRNRHLRSYFIGSATGEILAGKILSAIEENSLPLRKLLMVGRDGPNVNKKVERLINEEVLALRGKSLVKIGSCNIHTVHRAYEAGVKVLGQNASDLIFRIHDFFHDWPLRREDFTSIQQELHIPEHYFIKHVPSRWLSIENAANRLLEQWPAVKQYFLHFIPKNRSSLMKSKAYEQIVAFLKQKDIKAQLYFVSSSAKKFTRFTGTFQAAEPMVHHLHSELDRLVQLLMKYVCKPSSIKDLGVCKEVFESTHLMQSEKLELDDNCSKELAKLDDSCRAVFLRLAQKHFVAAALHIISKTSMDNAILKSCRCLKPSERKSSKSPGDIVKLSKALPISVDVDELRDEWLLLQIEDDPVAKEEEERLRNKDRIDVYWSHFIALKYDNGQQKFPLISSVVKAALCLSHGNAEIERGFSLSGKFLTDEKTGTTERYFNAYMSTQNALKSIYDNKPQFVHIDKSLLNLASHAHKSYQTHLLEIKKMDEERRQKEVEGREKMESEKERVEKMNKKSKELEEDESKLTELRKNLTSKRKIEKSLFEDANKKLKKAIENNDLSEIATAQAIFDAAHKARKTYDEEMKKVELAQKSIDSKKKKLLDLRKT